MFEDAATAMVRTIGAFEAYFSKLIVFPDRSVDLKQRDYTNSQYMLADKINDFERAFELWNFQYARLLAYGKTNGVAYCVHADSAEEGQNTIQKMIGDSGYALLNLLYSYTEIIGRLCGDYPNFPYKTHPANECITTGEFVYEGLTRIIPDLKELNEYERETAVTLFQEAVRNSLAHTYLTGENVILSGSHSEVLLVGTLFDKPAISINPRALFESILVHFAGYIEQLKAENPTGESEQLRKRFSKRFPNGLKSCRNKKKKCNEKN